MRGRFGHLKRLLTVAILLAASLAAPASPSVWKILPGHVPAVVARLTPVGILPVTNQLHLAIGLPLRDPAGLQDFLTQLYDPASTNYHQFLTPAQFTERFGPTLQDYAAVGRFALSNNLTVTQTHANRLLLDVSGSVADIQRAFRVTLRTYHHPTEKRDFYAPDTEPTVAVDLPITHVSGLSDYGRPHPKSHFRANAQPNATGSGPSGAYMGNDFRAAYLPGVTLTGTGQKVGLLQFDGFYSNDITAYEKSNSLPAVSLQTVLLDGYDGTPTSAGNVEVSLDIEMAIAMAPGLSQVVLFEAGPSGNLDDVLNAMVSSNQIKQFSCSWGVSGGPDTTADTIFQEMAAQGQSFFCASGDNDAFTIGSSSANGVNNPSLDDTPASSPYITQVGGTTLTTSGAGGTYVSEKAWNWNYDSSAGGYVGTSGGVSSYYTIPAWQTNVSMTVNHGSTTYRNIPDVALTGDNVYVKYNNGSGSTLGGTSCATPLWAALTALVNQEAVANGKASVGFVNPALYALGTDGNYALTFHDVTTGSNCWSGGSPTNYFAVTGYDLCTGWGTPSGQNVIIALVVGNIALTITPLTASATGMVGGPFFPNTGTFILTNTTSAALNWTLTNPVSWLKVSPTNGTLAAFGHTNVTFSFNAATSNLVAGTFTDNLLFSNVTAATALVVPFALQVDNPLSVTPASGFTGLGPMGGPFTVSSQTFVLTNLSVSSFAWSLVNTSSWLGFAPGGGTLAGGGYTNVTVSLAAAAKALSANVYTATVQVTNWAGVAASLPFTLSVGQQMVQNGGFETGDFTDWTLVGTANTGTEVYNAVEASSSYPLAVHSGSYGAFLGDTILATLSQSLATVAGQKYYLSLWLDNPTNGTTEIFKVLWNTNTLWAVTNPPVFTWTNLQFFETATGTNTTLQFAAENDPYGFGLDDITVTPLPVAGFRSITRATNQLALTWSAATNAIYQVQYRTNLVLGTWLNLGNSISATNSSITLYDTNVLTARSQRFYRLMVSP